MLLSFPPFCAGEKLSESRASDIRELCNTLLSAYLIQLLDTGLLHADPHPGNLIRTGVQLSHLLLGGHAGRYCFCRVLTSFLALVKNWVFTGLNDSPTWEVHLHQIRRVLCVPCLPCRGWEDLCAGLWPDD